jgi:hypothetical protein
VLVAVVVAVAGDAAVAVCGIVVVDGGEKAGGGETIATTEYGISVIM